MLVKLLDEKGREDVLVAGLTAKLIFYLCCSVFCAHDEHNRRLLQEVEGIYTGKQRRNTLLPCSRLPAPNLSTNTSVCCVSLENTVGCVASVLITQASMAHLFLRQRKHQQKVRMGSV